MMTKSNVREKDEKRWNNSNLFPYSRDVEDEQIIEFEGKIPQWLKGTLYRNGRGAYEINNDLKTSVNHTFDVRFHGSFIKSHANTQSLLNNRLIDPTTSTDDTGVTVQLVHNQLLALTETVTGNILDPETLELLGSLITLPYSQSIDSEIFTITTAHIMHNDKSQMIIGFNGRITHKGHWLYVIFISDQSFNQDKTGFFYLFHKEKKNSV
ncbi:unnamed protein product [Rotaria sp. Silwood2]|nr:unnamed protein product [Rotaria sp. Silwood2]CAF2973247.1 unnamed protein product [Rotaria sp. Silwood2]CAF3517067.1 unnamed protein product [Rotaria sp. Silwood2]CAF4172179.1 unnamed protein product [Rotaria sp. Silwood2]CAF4496900.1 unnamed protein product [Rotaria sp. Silwood2]